MVHPCWVHPMVHPLVHGWFVGDPRGWFVRSTLNWSVPPPTCGPRGRTSCKSWDLLDPVIWLAWVHHPPVDHLPPATTSMALWVQVGSFVRGVVLKPVDHFAFPVGSPICLSTSSTALSAHSSFLTGKGAIDLPRRPGSGGGPSRPPVCSLRTLGVPMSYR